MSGRLLLIGQQSADQFGQRFAAHLRFPEQENAS